MVIGDKPASARSRASHTLPERPALATVCLLFLCFVSTVFLLRYAQAILLPFILSVLFFYALDPVVSWMCGVGIPRVLASIVLMVAILGVGVSGAYLLRDQASELVDRLPEAIAKVRTAIETQRGGPTEAVAKVQQAAGELQNSATEAAGPRPPKGVTRVQVEEPLFRATDYIWSGSLGLMWIAGQATTVIFLVFFLLVAGDHYKRKLVEAVGPRLSRQKATVEILNEIDQQIGKFLLIQVLTSAIVGAAMGILLWLLGLNQAAMWGVAAGILNSIPYFGNLIVTGALALVAFLQFGTMEMVGIVAGATLLVTSLDGYLLTPLLTGKLSKLNNLAVFLSVLFWGWLWGPLGMLFAVPIMMVIQSICDHVERLKPIGHLLGEAHDS
jgi:predicted PurR-regulated permease PerM